MLTRRDALKLAAGLTGSVAGLAAPSVGAAPPVTMPTVAALPAPTSSPSPLPAPAGGRIITADEVMGMYRRYVALSLVKATDDAETWTTEIDSTRFVLDRQHGHVHVQGDGWEMRVSAGRVPLPVIFFGRPSRAAGYSFLFAATEFLERRPNT